MWLIRWSIIVVVLIALLGFSLQNQEQRVIIKVGTYISPEMPLYFALYLAFALGIFVFFLISIYNLVQLKTQIARQKRDNRKLREELDRLRNLSLDEDLPAILSGSDKEGEKE